MITLVKIIPFLVSTVFGNASPGKEIKPAVGLGFWPWDSGSGSLQLMMPALDIGLNTPDDQGRRPFDIGVDFLTLNWNPRNNAYAGLVGYTGYSIFPGEHKGFQAGGGVMLFRLLSLSVCGWAHDGWNLEYRAAIHIGWRGPVKLVPDPPSQ